MNKKDLIAAVAGKLGYGPCAPVTCRVVEAAFEAMAEALGRGEQVRINGFGVWRVRGRKAREGRNPRTGESIQIPAASGVIFRPADALKGRVNH